MRSILAMLLLTAVSSISTNTARGDIRTVSFQGWNDCLQLSNGTARVIVAPSAGGRILHYSRDGGANFLWEDPRAKGDTLERVGRWFPAGGYQIDLGPELEYPPVHLPLWLGRYKAERLGPLSVRLTSPRDRATSVQIVKVIQLDKKGAGLSVRQKMKNIGSEEIAYCLWDRTLTNATYGFFQLNPNSRFPARWSVRLGKRGAYSYNAKSPSSPRARIVGDLLVTVPGDKVEKVGADSPAGWIAGFHQGWLYVKRFPVFPNADYADGGNSVEIWVDAAGKRSEIEPLSPKVRLLPGQSYSFDERWDLRRVDEKIKGAGDIPKLLPLVRRMALPAGR